ncbi:P-loop containing nucleoside triphosphate hydrolase protein [Phycomyces nitens]|nr:P-loop containing nucleoside triphosphate hydrolase protein [Phycomyces nitens]
MYRLILQSKPLIRSLTRLPAGRHTNVRSAHAFSTTTPFRENSTITKLTSNSTHTTSKDPALQKRKADMIEFLYKNHQRPVPTGKKDLILTNCPHCIKIRKNSFAAYLDLAKSTYNCKTCGTRGSWQEYTRTLTKRLTDEKNDFQLISASNVFGSQHSLFSKPIEQVEAYPERLLQDTDVLEWLHTTYKIKPEIFSTYSVGLANYVDPETRLKEIQENEEAQESLCLTFPQTTLVYNPEELEDESSSEDNFKIDTVRIKAASLDTPSEVLTYDPPVPNRSVSAGLFGYKTITSESDSVIITRREFDAMAAYQETGVPSVSLPTANYQLEESVLPLLERFSKIYIWLDDDVDGQLAADRFANKLGNSRCMIVNTRMNALHGPLNAHSALLAGEDLRNILGSARQIKHDQIMDFSDLREEVYSEIMNPEQTRGVQSKDLPGWNSLLKGHRSGELTILTGPTGSGKTTIISQLSLDYCQSGVPTLWGSFEILNKRLAKRMLYQYSGKDLSKAPQEIDVWANKFEQLPLYFLKFFSSTAIKDVLKACSHAVYAHDVRHIILDNLQFMLSQQGRSSLDRWELQDEAIAELRRFATQQDVHITLVVHPRKDIGEQLDINSVFGSAKVTQEADNVVIIQKPLNEKGYRTLDVKKNRYDGTLGAMPYVFMNDSLKIRCLEKSEASAAKRASKPTSYTRYPKSKKAVIEHRANYIEFPSSSEEITSQVY